MPPRRTEHCWPVAHSLDDLLDVIPDPATYNPEEGVFIQRFMLEPVRNQFIRAIADRFEAAGWGVIYLVDNNWRGEEILDVIPTAQTICVRSGWQKRLEIAKERNQEVGLKSLALSEVNVNTEVAGLAAVWVPASVLDLAPKQCPVCERLCYISWDSLARRGEWSCQRGHRWRLPASRSSHLGKGQYEKAKRLSVRKSRPWSHEAEQKARQLRDQGLTWRQVGEHLGRSGPTVEIFLRKGGMAGTAARQKARALLADDGF